MTDEIKDPEEEPCVTGIYYCDNCGFLYDSRSPVRLESPMILNKMCPKAHNREALKPIEPMRLIAILEAILESYRQLWLTPHLGNFANN